MNNKEMMELRPELDSQFDELVKYCMASGVIDSNLYIEYDVKRGLRESNGKGVLTGLTEISDVVGFDVVTETGCRVMVVSISRDIMSRILSAKATEEDLRLKKQHIFCYLARFLRGNS